MATSNAKRQQAYRQRHLKAEDGTGERLNLIVAAPVKRSLTRLARQAGTTQRDTLERIIADAENRLLAGLSAGEQEAYYDRDSKPLQCNGLTVVQAETPLLCNEPTPVSDRDKRILELFGQGLSKRAIGRELDISDSTVRLALSKLTVMQ